jgi:hypothetical protein
MTVDVGRLTKYDNGTATKIAVLQFQDLKLSANS